MEQKNEGGQRVQISAIKISKFQSCNCNSMVTIVNNTIVYLKDTKRVDIKSSHHVQKYVR